MSIAAFNADFFTSTFLSLKQLWITFSALPAFRYPNDPSAHERTADLSSFVSLINDSTEF